MATKKKPTKIKKKPIGKKEDQKQYLIDQAETQRNMRKLFMGTLTLVSMLISKAVKDKQISASLLTSLLQSQRWLMDSFQKMQPKDFVEKDDDDGMTDAQRKLVNDFKKIEMPKPYDHPVQKVDGLEEGDNYKAEQSRDLQAVN